ncbi:MAG: hypothetical protein WEB00_14910 [Dehalococcoidia bacterium]
MPDVDAFHYGQSLRAYTTASAEDKVLLDRAIPSLRTNPHLDPPQRIQPEGVAVIFNLYTDSDVWIIYDFENDWTLGIYNMGLFKYDDPYFWDDELKPRRGR